METVYVWRSPDVPGYADPAPISRWSALVAPRREGEFAEVGRAGVIVGYTIYIEDQGPTGIRDSDLIEVRSPVVPRQGIEEWETSNLETRIQYIVPVEGLPGEWQWRDGSHKGDEISVRVVKG